MYRTGHLRSRVTFETATVAPNSVGDPVKSYSTVGVEWARVESLAGRERFASMVQQGQAEYRVVARYRSDLAVLGHEDRLTHGGKRYDIRWVENVDERNKELIFYCTEHVGLD